MTHECPKCGTEELEIRCIDDCVDKMECYNCGFELWEGEKSWDETFAIVAGKSD